MRSTYLSVLSLAAALLSACGGDPAGRQLAPLPELASYTVAARGAEMGRSWDGVVEATRQAVLSAQTNGRVSSIAVDVNQTVAAGDVLLRLTAIEQQAGTDTARAQLRAAEAVVAEAQSRFRRATELVDRQLVSRADFDAAKAARDSALAARDAASAQLTQAGQQAQYTVVRAPYAGVISARDVEPGEAVVSGQRLLALYAPEALRVEVQVPQSDAEAIRSAPRARIVLADGRSVDAAEVVVYPSADPATHTVPVRVTLPSLPRPPHPGVTAKVVFAIAGGSADIRIPVASVVQRGEVSGVYVLQDNRVSLRQLRLGARSGNEVHVIAGLEPGERIATDPVAALQALVDQRAAASGATND